MRYIVNFTKKHSDKSILLEFRKRDKCIAKIKLLPDRTYIQCDEEQDTEFYDWYYFFYHNFECTCVDHAHDP